MKLWRAHGLGNDYLVLEQGGPINASLARAVCDRHRGAGSDGLLEPFPSGRADRGVRIWNPDGSIAEKSGNGLRIFARWVFEREGVATMSADTGHDVVRCAVRAHDVEVQMGAATFLDAPSERSIDVPGGEVQAVALSVGNPHLVVMVDDPDAVPWRRWGAWLERHERFPARTNVQFATPTGPRRALARIWERGAGETMASGSSACAVAAAMVRTGRLTAGTVDVDMQGGSLQVDVQPAYALVLRGPVEGIGVVELDDAWLASRGALPD